jgi:hypothetical protein
MSTAELTAEARAEFEEVWQELVETWNAGNQYKAMAWQMFYLAWERCESKREQEPCKQS